MLNDQSFLRYSRQLLLEEVGLSGQQRLQSATVLLAGLGGLGSPAALYLAAAGVGTLLLADHDKLDITNLQRQILYKTNNLGLLKSKLAHNHLNDLNPQGRYVSLTRRLEGEWLDQHVKQANLVLDCSDNMKTRHDINAACIKNSKPLISASAVGFSGQIMILKPPWTYGCYHCLFPNKDEVKRNCRTAGVLGPVVGIIGAMQALEAIKFLCGILPSSDGKLYLFDGRSLQWTTLNLSRDNTCQVCSLEQ